MEVGATDNCLWVITGCNNNIVIFSGFNLIYCHQDDIYFFYSFISEFNEPAKKGKEKKKNSL